MPSLPNQLILELGEVDLNVFWFVKDFGWALCLPHIYTPAAATAIVLGACLFVGRMRWGNNSAQTAHTLAELMWVIGNSAWMISEALYDPGKSGLPWHITPIIRPDKAYYGRGTMACVTILGIAALGLIGFYGSLLMQKCCGNQDSDEEVVWGFIPADAYPRCFILPWILKDVCWCLEHYYLAITFGALALFSLADALRRNWKGFERLALLLISEMFWNIGNAVWMTDELMMDNQAPALRYAPAAVFALITCANIPFSLLAAKVTGRVDDKPSETTPVLSAGKGGLPGGGGVFVADTLANSNSA